MKPHWKSASYLKSQILGKNLMPGRRHAAHRAGAAPIHCYLRNATFMLEP